MHNLEKSLFCISPCLRGYGYSSYNKPIKSLKDFAEDLKLFIEEHFNFQEFYILGHSEGCIIAMYLSLMIPKRIKGIEIFNTPKHTGS